MALTCMVAPAARAQSGGAAGAVTGASSGVVSGAAAHAVDGATAQGAPAAVHAAAADPSPGYWLLASDGGVYQFVAPYDGSLRGMPLNRPVVGMAATPDGGGYWLVASDGGIFSFGDARFFGSTGSLRLNRPVVGMAATPDGGGYWLVASDGGIFSFGDARFFGSTGSLRLNRPVVGMAATPDGGGYWLVASDGGIFSFGDARFFGSTGSLRLNQPVLGMAPVPGGSGYWLVASDGGIFSFGSAAFFGSTGAMRLNRPVVGMAANPYGGGYWLVASDGGIFSFGSAPFAGSTGGHAIPFPIIGMAATRLGFPYPPSGTGFDVSWPQCGGPLPPPAAVSVVGVDGGSSHNSTGTNLNPNPCLGAEAAWAGQGLTVYINVDGVFVGDPPAAASGPAGVCAATDLVCQGYNWGWDGAGRSVAYAHSLGLFPTVWWLDVEGPCGFRLPALWRCNGAAGGLAANAAVIEGAVNALHANGLIAGIYSTYLQFPATVGTGYNPGTPIWIAGASTVANAAATCVNAARSFAGGTPWLVQYGYSPAPSPEWDPDYACPQS